MNFLITEDGVRLFYRAVGAGPNAIIVPNAVYLYDQLQPLAEHRGLTFFDMRNRGESETVADPSKLSRGVHHDVEDIEAVRRHLGIDQVDLIGHSYLGLVVILYAMRYPEHVRRIVQFGPQQPFFTKKYPPELSNVDAVAADVWAQLGEMQKQPPPADRVEFCRGWWAVMRRLFVMDPADLPRIADWGFCHLANERNFMRHFIGNLMPSIQALPFTAEDYAKVTAPVLTIHGRQDRNAPYGGGVEWASILPHAKLVTVENAAHVPWIEAPELVFGSIEEFLKP